MGKSLRAAWFNYVDELDLVEREKKWLEYCDVRDNVSAGTSEAKTKPDFFIESKRPIVVAGTPKCKKGHYQTAKVLTHAGDCLICLKQIARAWIRDQGIKRRVARVTCVEFIPDEMPPDVIHAFSVVMPKCPLGHESSVENTSPILTCKQCFSEEIKHRSQRARAPWTNKAAEA